jgi:pyruvate-formate lyase-activating enzyme
VPIIKKITCNKKNKEAIEKFISGFGHKIPIDYLNYIPLAKRKYQKLSISFTLEQIFLFTISY